MELGARVLNSIEFKKILTSLDQEINVYVTDDTVNENSIITI